MEPATLIALTGLVGTLAKVGGRLVESWMENRSGGIVLGADGSRYDLAQGSRFVTPQYTAPSGMGMGAAIPFEGVFVPADSWAESWLLPDQPVLVVIEDQDERSPLDSVVALMPLGSGFEGSLFPSDYVLGAFVFLDEDPDTWDDLDGGALVGFSVRPGEPPFSLEIPIEAVPDPLEIPGGALFGIQPLVESSGYLNTGEEDHYEAVFDGDVTYAIYVEPANPSADLDLFVFDENGNQVVQDEGVSSDAFCSVTPRWSGPFTLVVRCHRGSTPYDITVAA